MKRNYHQNQSKRGPLGFDARMASRVALTRAAFLIWAMSSLYCKSLYNVIINLLVNFSNPNGKKLGEYGGKVNLLELNLWIAKKPQ